MILTLGCINLTSKSANSESGGGEFSSAMVSYLQPQLGESRGTHMGERVPARKALAVLDSENPPKCGGLGRAASMDFYIKKDRQFLDLTSGAL